MEDLERILNCSTSIQMNEDLYLVKKVEPELVREGFRILYSKYHKEDLEHFMKSYNSFPKLILE
jgi:hypothetical protein